MPALPLIKHNSPDALTACRSLDVVDSQHELKRRRLSASMSTPLAILPDPALHLLLQVFRAAIARLIEMPSLDGLVEPLFALHEGPVVPEACISAILSAAAEGLEVDIAGAVHRAFKAARVQAQQPSSGSAAALLLPAAAAARSPCSRCSTRIQA